MWLFPVGFSRPFNSFSYFDPKLKIGHPKERRWWFKIKNYFQNAFPSRAAWPWIFSKKEPDGRSWVTLWQLIGHFIFEEQEFLRETGEFITGTRETDDSSSSGRSIANIWTISTARDYSWIHAVRIEKIEYTTNETYFIVRISVSVSHTVIGHHVAFVRIIHSRIYWNQVCRF